MSLVRRGIGELDALSTVFHRSYHLGLLAGIHVQLGDIAAGQHALEEAYDEVARTEVRLFEAELRRIEGELQLLAGAPKAGEACFVDACGGTPAGSQVVRAARLNQPRPAMAENG